MNKQGWLPLDGNDAYIHATHWWWWKRQQREGRRTRLRRCLAATRSISPRKLTVSTGDRLVHGEQGEVMGAGHRRW